jgi:SAM-dependent methyltransferase
MKRMDEYANTAEFYDHISTYRERQDLSFFVEMAAASAGPMLEIGCGTGRVLLPIARAGLEITGMDMSPSMLSVCRERLAREPSEVQRRVQLREGDMRDFELSRKFTLITLPFRPFQHLLTVADQLACLQHIHRHLAPQGRVIIDVFNPALPFLIDEKYFEESPAEPEFIMPDGRKVARYFRFTSRDPIRQVNEVELIYYVTHPEGRKERLVHAFAMRYFFRYELEHLLARAGFVVETLYGNYDKSPFGANSSGELILVARKE